MLPFMVLTVASVLQNIDRSLIEAARDLGCTAGPRLLPRDLSAEPPRRHRRIAHRLHAERQRLRHPEHPERWSRNGHVDADIPAIRRGAELRVRGGTFRSSSSPRRWFWSCSTCGARSRRPARACEGMRVDRVMRTRRSRMPSGFRVAGGDVLSCAAADIIVSTSRSRRPRISSSRPRVYAAVVREVTGRRHLSWSHCGSSAVAGRELRP